MTTTAALIGLGVIAVWLAAILRWSGQVRRGNVEARSRLNWAYVGGLAALARRQHRRNARGARRLARLTRRPPSSPRR